MIRARLRRRRALAAAAGLLFGVLCVLLGPAAPASAHAALVASDPQNGTIVPDAPNRVTLTFSESVQLVEGRIQVLGPDGKRADQGEPQADGATVTVPLRSGGGRGTYVVSYRVISADSHPIGGSLSYSVAEPSTPPVAAGDAASNDPVVRTLISVGKYLGYAGLVLLVGPVLVLALLWPHRLSRRGPARVVYTGIGLVLGSTLLGLWLQAPYAAGASLFGVGFGDLRDVLGSTFGAVMLVRLGVICAAAVLLRPLLRTGGESKADLALLGALGVAALATWPLSGHPTASPVAGVSVVLDAIHLAAMAVWLGGLLMLLAFLLPQADARELSAILPIWSRWAATAVSALLLAGVVQALIEVASLSGLVDSTYGRLILVKAGLAAVVIAVAAVARTVVRKGGVPESPRPLRRLVAVELGVSAVVLAVTAALVQIPPPRTAEAAETAATKNTTVSQTLRNSSMSLQVDIFPATVGNNSLHLYAYTPDNKPLPVVEWTATAALPAKGIEPIEVPLLRITDFHAIGDVALPAAGDWTFKFTLRTSDIDQSTVTMTAKIS
ncbi:copper resistance protein CopC [Krasilnikovia sp. M28-CT-15]|uniref:copper resistance CopC/CopD family protein n=1 Tax=Krasilnikovia sp. M28-CT-15 TaxID=3373540 RepID=UPI00399CFC6D